MKFEKQLFLLLCITGLTFSFIVSLWHKKSRSISGMSTEDHAKAFMCLTITSTIWSCISWPSDEQSLNFFASICFSWTSPAGTGRLRWWLPLVWSSLAPVLGWWPYTLPFFFSGYSQSSFSLPSGQTWWKSPLPRWRETSSSCASLRPLRLFKEGLPKSKL